MVEVLSAVLAQKLEFVIYCIKISEFHLLVYCFVVRGLQGVNSRISKFSSLFMFTDSNCHYGEALDIQLTVLTGIQIVMIVNIGR